MKTTKSPNINPTIKSEAGSFFFRGLVAGVPVFVCSLTFLWATDYPQHLWPWMTGVFYALVIVWELIVGFALLAVAKRMLDYGLRVLRAHGIDIGQIEDGPKPSRTGLLLVTLLALVGVVWGLSIFSLGLVNTLWGSPPFAPVLYSLAGYFISVGAGTLSLLLGFPMLRLWLADKRSNAELSDSWVSNLVSVAGERSPLGFSLGQGALFNIIGATRR